MPDSKVSQLQNVATQTKPEDTLYIVQDGVSKKLPVGNVTFPVKTSTDLTNDIGELTKRFKELFISMVNSGNIDLQLIGNQNVDIYTDDAGVKTRVARFSKDGVTIEYPITVKGSVNIDGQVMQVNTEQITIADNVILLNKNQIGTPMPTLISGLEVERGDLPNYFFGFDEQDDAFKVGEHGTLQTLATRQNTPINNGLAFWNDTTKRFETSSVLDFTGTDLRVSGRRMITCYSGTTFPTNNIGIGDECFRTDLDEFYKYTGTTWIQI